MGYSISAGVLAVVVFSGSCIAATTLGMPSPGYVYFHQRGSDIEYHNKSVEQCAIAAAKTIAPSVQSFSAPNTSLGNTLGNTIGALLLGNIQGDIAHAHFTANIENCMVVFGWDVVRLDDREGKVLSKLDTKAQSEALAPLVGADDVHGIVVRRYEPVLLTNWTTAGFGQSARDSLSVTSDADAIIRIANLEQTTATNWDDRLIQISPIDPAKIPQGLTTIVLRGVTPDPPNSWMDLVYLGETDDDAPQKRTTYLRLELPTKSFLASGTKERTVTFVVPAGRWAIADISTVGFCLSTSSFIVHPGEVVFAGSFNSQALFSPDLSLEPAQKTLGDNWIARSLKPAQYRNGDHFSCDRFPQTILYKLAIAEP